MAIEQADVADSQASEEERLELPVRLLDREIYVRMPTPEQLLVWQRTVDRLEKSPMDPSWTGSQVMAALDRLRRIVDSILVNRQTDADWLDDQFLDETLSFQTLAPFITDVVKAFREYQEAHGTRSERRAAVKKTSRKAARKATP